MTGPYLPADLEPTLNAAIDQRVEGRKLDFKREISLKGEAGAEFMVDILSIVNTDDADHFGDSGYLIIGFDKEGAFHELPTDFNADTFSADLNRKLADFISPHVPVQVVHPLSHEGRTYAAIRIPPSNEQPHMMIRQTAKANPGQWWVRKGDTKALAGPEDYARVLSKQVARHTAPLRDEVAAMRGLHAELTQRIDRLLLNQVVHAGLPAADAPGVSVAAKIRAQYGTPDDAAGQALRQGTFEFLQSWAQFVQETDSNGNLGDATAWRGAIEQVETITRPLGEALAAAIIHAGGALDGAVMTVLRQVARGTLKWPSSGELTEVRSGVLAHALNLLLYTVYAASVQVKRPMLIRQVTDTNITVFSNQRPWLDYMRLMVRDDARASASFDIHTPAASYQHLQDVVLGDESGWLSTALPFADLHLLALQTDLTLSLSYLTSRHRVSGKFLPAVALPNTVVYAEDANEVTREFLESHGGFIEQATGRDPEALTRLVIEQVQHYSDQGRYWIPLTTEALASVPAPQT